MTKHGLREMGRVVRGLSKRDGAAMEGLLERGG